MTITVKHVLLFMVGLWISGADTSLMNEKPSFRASRPRLTRATDKYLTLEVERMQNVARLITGISIQLGLTSGKIPPEKVISELLHLGSVTHTQIISMDATKVKKAIEDLKSLPSKLEADDVSRNVEEKLKLIEDIRGLVQDIDVMDWKKKTEFGEEMEDLKNKGLDLTDVKSLHKKVDAWTAKLDEIKTMNFDASNPNGNGATYNIDRLNALSNELLTMISAFAANQTKPWTYQKIDNIAEALKPISNGVEAVKMAFDNDPKIRQMPQDTQVFTTYAANLQSLSDASSSVTEALASLQIVRSVISERLRPGSPLEFPGFPERFRDINKISVGLADSWMKAVFDSDSLASALKPLNSLASTFEQVDNSLGSANDEDVAMIQGFLDLAEEIMKNSMDNAEMETIMQSYIKCTSSFLPNTNPDLTSTANLLSNATNLETKVIEIRDMVHSFMGLLDTDNVRTSLENVRDLTVASSDPSKVANTVSQLKNSKEINALNLVLSNAERMDFRKFVYDMPNIKQLAGVVSKEITSVDSFLNSLSTQPAFFKCLREIDNAKASQTTNAVRMTQKIRSIQPVVITDGETVVNRVVNAASNFKALEGAIGNMNKQPTGDSEALKKLPDPEKHSGTIGAAARGIGAMKRAIDERAQADLIVMNADVVNGLLSTATLEQKDMDLLDDVVQLKTSFDPMYLKLEAWKEGIKETDATVLASHSAVFTSAKMVPGVDGDLREMSEAVEKLRNLVTEPTVQSKLDSVKKALETLDSIGLDFASYKAPFDGSDESLAALDLAFALAKTKVTSPKTPTGNTPVASQQNPMTSGINPSTEKDTGSTWLPWIIVPIVVIVILILIGAIVYVMWKPFSKVVLGINSLVQSARRGFQFHLFDAQLEFASKICSPFLSTLSFDWLF